MPKKPRPKHSVPAQLTAPHAEQLALDSKELMKAVMRKALAGNVTALRLCVERLLPIARERTVPVQIPRAESALQITSALAAVFDAVTSGQLTPSEAQRLAAILENQRRAIETAVFEERIAALESNMETGPQSGQPSGGRSWLDNNNIAE